MRHCKTCTLLLVVLLVFLAGQAGAQGSARRWGVGTFLNYDAPLLGLRDWYEGTGKMGVTLIFVSSPTRAIEIEYHHAKFRDGAVEGREFEWAADGQRYLSPEASADMTLNSVLISAVLYYRDLGLAFSRARYTPYLVVGGGFFGYDHEVSGLIYPGQTIEPLDPEIKLEPFTDKRKAVGATLGGGVEAFVTDNVSVDLRARYNFMVGELRPMEAWRLERVFPLQSFDVGAGVKFYFWQ